MSIKLPPLPKDAIVTWGYTADQMHAHAAAVSAAKDERIKVLEDALENIADITAKETIHKIARAALGDKHD